MLMSLGMFVFERATLPFGDVQQRLSWNHARSPRFGARDASQYVGPGEDNVTLSGACIPQVGGDYASISTLREMADTGERYPLVDGEGEVWGDYVIVALDLTRKHYVGDDGRPRWTDFTLTLDRVPDAASAGASSAASSGRTLPQDPD